MDEAPPLKAAAARARGARGGKSVNLRDIAEHAKVSIATVSMVLNDNPRISRPTQLRVQRLINQMGYRPNRLAQSLSSKYTRVLAALLPALRHGFADAYFGELISGICDRAGKLNYKVMLEQAKPDFIKEREHVEIFERRYVDGLLCLGFNDRHSFLKDFEGDRYPFIMVDNHSGPYALDHVMCDYRGGSEQVMNYLLQLGHRTIGLITGAPEAFTARDVIDVYERKLRAAGVEPSLTMRADGRFTEDGGAKAAERIFANHPDVTAVFAGNDKMALGAMHQLRRRGLSIPLDVSVVGFDDLGHSAFVNPSLTTVHLPLYEVGTLACERLIERIHGKVERVADRLPTHLVVRDSTAMAPSPASNTLSAALQASSEKR